MTLTDLLSWISISQVHGLISNSCAHVCIRIHNTYKPYYDPVQPSHKKYQQRRQVSQSDAHT